jgi:hypothetical protein
VRYQNRCIKIDKDFGCHNTHIHKIKYLKDYQESRHGAKRSIITTAAVAPKNPSILSNSLFIKDEQTTNRAGQADLESLFLHLFYIQEKYMMANLSLDLIFDTADFLNTIVAGYLG